jgi:hypothetical protein
MKNRGGYLKKVSRGILLILISFIVLFAGSELSYRIYRSIKYKTVDLSLKNRIELKNMDQELGWKGRAYFGNIESKKLKIFCVGDSYTHGINLDQEELYFNYLKDELNAEIFAYGGGGYGTLQEYLVLKRYLGLIKPDIVVIQVCMNDFINNSQALESQSYINANYSLRPYYENGNISYHFPKRAKLLNDFLIPNSRIIYLIMNRVDRFCSMLAQKKILNTVEDEIKKMGASHKDFFSSVLVTSQIIEKIKEQCGGIFLCAFNADNEEPYFSQFKNIFRDHKIAFIEEIPELVQHAENQGHEVRLKDGHHWNKLGNEIAGKCLASNIMKRISSR